MTDKPKIYFRADGNSRMGLGHVIRSLALAEMLRDDSRRYVNRAVAHGSPAHLQTWPHMVHVWHMFYPRLAEAGQAWDEIHKFIDQADREADAKGARQ